MSRGFHPLVGEFRATQKAMNHIQSPVPGTGGQHFSSVHALLRRPQVAAHAATTNDEDVVLLVLLGSGAKDGWTELDNKHRASYWYIIFYLCIIVYDVTWLD